MKEDMEMLAHLHQQLDLIREQQKTRCMLAISVMHSLREKSRGIGWEVELRAEKLNLWRDMYDLEKDALKVQRRAAYFAKCRAVWQKNKR